jgi:hypothetical protein
MDECVKRCEQIDGVASPCISLCILVVNSVQMAKQSYSTLVQLLLAWSGLIVQLGVAQYLSAIQNEAMFCKIQNTSQTVCSLTILSPFSGQRFDRCARCTHLVGAVERPLCRTIYCRFTQDTYVTSSQVLLHRGKAASMLVLAISVYS